MFVFLFQRALMWLPPGGSCHEVTEGERVSYNTKFTQAPSVIFFENATSLSEGGLCEFRSIIKKLPVIFSRAVNMNSSSMDF